LKKRLFLPLESPLINTINFYTSR